MTTYNLQIAIQDTEFTFLTENNYKLCLAKASKNGYTVVWNAEDFSEINTFKWTSEYQALYVDRLNGLCVEQQPYGTDVKFGQTVEIKKNRQMGAATGDADPAAHGIKIVNNLGKPTYVALNSMVNGDWRVCYVSPNMVGNGNEITLEPVEKIKVWFEQDVATGTMMSCAMGTGFEVDFTTGAIGQVAWFGAPNSKHKQRGVIGKGGSGIWGVVPGVEP